MTPERRRKLWEVARWLRQLAALGLCLVALRFAWLATSATFHQFAATSQTGDDASPDDAAERERNARKHREGRERTDSIAGIAKGAELAKDLADHGDPEPAGEPTLAEPPPATGPSRPRNLLVDIGPSRSEVIVNGHLVGKTPYAGQWSCGDGERISIAVLPPANAESLVPLKRQVTCRGSTLVARR